MEDQREFKGIWIPRDIWLDKRLNAIEKVLFAEIDSLSGYELKCIKSNESFAEFCQCSESKVSKAIKKLIDFGYVEQVSFDGRRRTLQSRLVKNASLNNKNNYSDEHKMPASNSISNSENNPIIDTSCDEKRKNKKEDYSHCEEVINLFIDICKDLPKPMKLTDARRKAIHGAEHDVAKIGGWEQFFNRVQESDFLSGRKCDWRADFDWVLKQNNRIKIIEGKYSEQLKQKSNERANEPVDFNQALKQLTASFTSDSENLGPTFEDFWNIYPNKYGKGDAERAWNEINPDSELTKRIIETAGRIAKVEKYSGEGAAYILAPGKWLSGKHWEDEVLQPPKTYSYEFTRIGGDSVEENALRNQVKVKVKENE